MALTTYSGLTLPVIYRTNIAGGTPANTSHLLVYTTGQNPWPGGYIYLIVNIPSSAVAVASITWNGGGAWVLVSRLWKGSLSQEVWVVRATVEAFAPVTLNLTAAAVVSVSSLIVEKGDATAPTVSVTQVGSAAATALSIPAITVGEANTSVIMITRIRGTAAGVSLNVTENTVKPGSAVLEVPVYNAGWTAAGSRGVAFALPVPPAADIGGIDTYTSSPLAVGSQVGWDGVLSVAKDYVTAIFVVRGQRVTLDDYNYSYGDNGIVLNNATGTPIYDIEKITGLTDIKIDSDSSDYDGADGGYTFAKYLAQKTIVFDGTTYSSASIDLVADGLRANFLPVDDAKPLHYVHPGIGRRVIYCKPIGFTADIDRARARGAMPFQVQLQAPDPHAYGASYNLLLTNGSVVPLTVGGQRSTAPIIWFYNSTSDVVTSNPHKFLRLQGQIGALLSGSIEVSTLKQGVQLPIGTYKLDMALRTLVNVSTGANCTNFLTVRDWWLLEPGGNSIAFNSPGGLLTKADVCWSEAWA